ncbi:hypothetical protein [Lacimicrobium alkaliphilum]|uniref:VCBS repeat-containing protein n=1 Tax=Lacimicrobium alkaliphilum TaxID=1526571 RepID=A0A0U2PD52_9ALTE|nr:hypothetical protein [Lacimicrobium alkaliphilum]ALS96973.1 hypothetical protein AT746_00875 [Lacimicrobium alkaliphilum]
MRIESHQASFELAQQRLFHHQRQVIGEQKFARNPAGDNQQQHSAPFPKTEAEQSQSEDIASTDEDYRQILKKRLIELMSGRELEWYDPSQISNKNNQSESEPQSSQPEPGTRLLVREQTLDYQAYQLQFELQVQGKDGLSRAFSASMDWEQLNITERLTVMTAQQLKDPLVLNFDWQAVSFDGDTSFDLDGDGKTDALPTPRGNAGYLVKDINNNTRIDGPAELAGAKSGDAWADIRQMDSNGDGWLNSDDKSFEQLYWWQPGAGRQLFSLADLKVDGLLLQGADTQADIAPQGKDQARLRRSGAFIYQGNQLGLMQQFDFYI